LWISVKEGKDFVLKAYWLGILPVLGLGQGLIGVLVQKGA